MKSHKLLTLLAAGSMASPSLLGLSDLFNDQPVIPKQINQSDLDKLQKAADKRKRKLNKRKGPSHV